MGDSEEDEFDVPLGASPEWWRGLSVSEVGVVWGGYEFFRDDIESWVKKVKVSVGFVWRKTFSGGWG